MVRCHRCGVAVWITTIGLLGAATLRAQDTVSGERLDPATYGPGVVESLQAAIDRDAAFVGPPAPDSRERNGQHGQWAVPSRGATTLPHSGSHNVVNTWGDTRMGIGFPTRVDVQGAWFAGQASEGAWTPGLRAVGYRGGQAVQETEWFRSIGAAPRWMAMNLKDVDRIEIVALPALNGGGWYGMDDLTYTPRVEPGQAPAPSTVVSFDDLNYDTKLTGTTYAGLTWEIGTGEFTPGEAVHAPLAPAGARTKGASVADEEPASERTATAPVLVSSFQGVLRGDATSMIYPPDTDGAIGPNHYVETVNRNFAVYDKASGAQITNILLGAFLPGSNGDPRVLFDHFSQRWIVLVTDFNANAKFYLAVSLSDDPTGAWFKTNFVTAQGADAGKWPDYPTLGVDANGIYSAAYMVGGSSGMTIFAIDKAPLIAPTPSLGTITAFRNLPWEGAIQPAHTYGTPAGEFLVSTNNGNKLRVRRVNPPLTAPTLTEVGLVSVPSFTDPPDAPALGSGTPLDTVDSRLMMAVYRDGSVWTCHTVTVSGRAGCRWYQITTAPPMLIQSGTVADTSLYYFFPSIMVNPYGHVVLGFTGSSSSQYPGGYFTGRLSTDPLSQMAPPVQFKPGTAAQNNIDSYGRNRWGDYSYTTLDPVTPARFWTIQEYGHASDIWGTYIGVVKLPFIDCNENDIPDEWEIGHGLTTDCDGNGVPDTCEVGLTPSITQPPTPQTAYVGQSTGFAVTATGFGALSYQWRKDGVDLSDGGNLSGAATAALTINPVGFADAGNYDAVVTSACGTVTSTAAALTVWLRGDMNCDRVINFGDINPFVVALNGATDYQAAYPNCNWLSADCNGDGVVDFADINPFVELLSVP